MEIEIVKNKYGSLFAVDTKSLYGLFQFEYRKTKDMGGPAWYFWLRGGNDPDIFNGKKKDFPMEFFTNACKSKLFILTGKGMDEDVEIVKGEDNLTK